tara:strand:+ start:5791 stop:6108 length:318 start_codon:yes stop_codon:yes gene_type:complete
MSNWIEHLDELASVEADVKKKVAFQSSAKLIKELAKGGADLREELAALKAEKEELIWGLKDAKLFAAWVECLGRTDCEIYKHELKVSADLAIDRINKFLDDEDES